MTTLLFVLLLPVVLPVLLVGLFWVAGMSLVLRGLVALLRAGVRP